MICSVGSKCCYSTLKDCPLKQSFCLWRKSLFKKRHTVMYVKFTYEILKHLNYSVLTLRCSYLSLNECLAGWFDMLISSLPVWMHWFLQQILQPLWPSVDRHQRLQYFPAPISGLPADPRNPSCPGRVHLQCFGRRRVDTISLDCFNFIISTTWLMNQLELLLAVDCELAQPFVRNNLINVIRWMLKG